MLCICLIHSFTVLVPQNQSLDSWKIVVLFFITLSPNKHIYSTLPCPRRRLRSLLGVWNNCVKSWTLNWLGVTATDLPIIPLLSWDWQRCQKKRRMKDHLQIKPHRNGNKYLHRKVALCLSFAIWKKSWKWILEKTFIYIKSCVYLATCER